MPESDGGARAAPRAQSWAEPAPATAAGPAVAEVAPASNVKASMAGRVFTIAWLSILLGLAVEGFLLALAAGLGDGFGDARSLLAAAVQKVSWSFLVCVGIGLGSAAVKARPATMGILGVLAAPTAFTVAKAVHKGMGAALGLAAAVGGPSAVVVAGIKAVQYGLFGYLVGRLSQSDKASLWRYVAIGIGAGVLFGGIVTVLHAQAGADGITLITRGANEVLFPLGCALVLYATDAFNPSPAT